MPRKKASEEAKKDATEIMVEDTEARQFSLESPPTDEKAEAETESEKMELFLPGETNTVTLAASDENNPITQDTELDPDDTIAALDETTDTPATTDLGDLKPEPKPKLKRVRRRKPEPSPAENNIKTVPASEAFPSPVQPESTQSHTDVPGVLYLERTAPTPIQNESDTIWHDLQHSRVANRILTGTIGAIEVNQAKTPLVIVYYRQKQRVAIPYSEMGIPADDPLYNRIYTIGTEADQQSKILNGMLGAEIDFIVRGLDSKTRTAVASRASAMRKKRAHFYFTPDSDGLPFVRPGRRAEARVIAVSRYSLRVEIFGVEAVIGADNLSWDWINDVSELYSVGDIVIVHIASVTGATPKELVVEADVKSLSPNRTKEKLLSCSIGARYHGVVSDIRRGVVQVQLANGVLAVAHSCYDRHYPGVRDEVACIVTAIDQERNRAMVIISKIIKRNV